MPERVESIPTGMRGRQLLPWMVVEGILVLAFLFSWTASDLAGALPVLLVPLLGGLVLALGESDFSLLVLFSVLYALAWLELLPTNYGDLGLFFVIPGLVAFTRVTRTIVSEPTSPVRGVGRAVSALLVVVCLSVLVSALTSVLGGWSTQQIARSSFVLLLVMLIIWIFATTPRSSVHVRVLYYVLAFGCAAACLTLPFFAGSVDLGKKTVSMLFGNVSLNLVGMVASAVSLMLLAALFDKDRPVRLFVVVAGISVMLAVLAYSRSRGAWFGFAVGLLYMLFRLRSLRLVFVMACCAGLLLSTELFRSALLERAEASNASDPAFVTRLFLWRSAASAFVKNWLFGVGVEGFRHVKYSYGFPRLWDPLDMHGAHNLFLEQFVGLGLFGGVSFLLLPAIAISRVSRFLRGDRRMELSGLATGLGAALVAFCSHCLMDSPGWHAATFAMFGVLTGLSLAMVRSGVGQGGLE